ncbi:hypothetical protein Syun_018383 [Stephania yunnanensis]|uniref:Uncharacterized protein n=1 Tax=Stephania yunnanensis TaxID=152371 RepID=A0AAP0IUF8_9MAGN
MVTFSTKQLHEKASKAEVSLHEVPLALETSYWRGHLMSMNLKRSGNLRLSYVAVSIPK